MEKITVILLSLLLAGCAANPIIQTQVIDKPIPVFCQVKIPAECKDAYAMDKVSNKDGMLKINRALRAEIEERTACELMLRAAINGCNSNGKTNN